MHPVMKDMSNGPAPIHINAGLHQASIFNSTLVLILFNDLPSGLSDQLCIYDDKNYLLVAVQNDVQSVVKWS